MKTKDIVALGLAGIIITVVGVLLVGKFSGGSQHKRAQVEVVDPVESGFDDTAKRQLVNSAAARDFSVPIDLRSGLGNVNPFGQ